MRNTPTFDQGVSYNALHEELVHSIDELNFFKFEIDFFQKLIEEQLPHLVNRSELIEQFQNKIILQNEQIDLLKHEINVKIQKLNLFIKSHLDNINFIKFNEFDDLKEKIRINRKLYLEFKHEIYSQILKTKAL